MGREVMSGDAPALLAGEEPGLRLLEQAVLIEQRGRELVEALSAHIDDSDLTGRLELTPAELASSARRLEQALARVRAARQGAPPAGGEPGT